MLRDDLIIIGNPLIKFLYFLFSIDAIHLPVNAFFSFLTSLVWHGKLSFEQPCVDFSLLSSHNSEPFHSFVLLPCPLACYCTLNEK